MSGRHIRSAVLVLTGLTFAFGLVRYQGPAVGYWDTYITAPAMFMNKEPVNFTLDKAGRVPAYRFALRGVLPDDLVDKHEGSYGIITKDQRIGGGITASLTFAFFGQLGFRLLFALSIALVVPLTWLAFRRLWGPGHDLAGLGGGLLLAWNPFVLAVDRLNANLFALPLMLLVLYLLFERPIRWVALGVVFGVLAGIRNEAVCFVPAIAWWVLRSQTDVPPLRRLGRLVGIGAVTVVALAPVLYWKWYAFGNPLMHPSQYPHFHGFRPEFEHSLFGWTFRFNGLFNWPLHHTLVRTPHFGFPTYLLFPLVTVRAFGLVLSAVVLLGAWHLIRSRRDEAVTLVLWMAFVYLLFGPQENWEEVKMTFMLLAYPPLALMGAAGLVALGERVGRPRRLVAVGVLTLALFGGVRAAGRVDAPADVRWYVRFPKAAPTRPGVQRGLQAIERNDYVYFESCEDEAEIARERAKLTAGWPWPARYLPTRWTWASAWERMRAESGTRGLTVEEIWGHIYDQLR